MITDGRHLFSFIMYTFQSDNTLWIAKPEISLAQKILLKKGSGAKSEA